MSEREASEVLVECLEAEGVEHVFGTPGEEIMDLNESLADSSSNFIPVRHEQGVAYMAYDHRPIAGLEDADVVSAVAISQELGAETVATWWPILQG